MTNTDSEVLIKAISNEIRRNIIRLLVNKGLTYSEIAHLLNFNLRKESGKFNFHLKELTSAGLVVNTDDIYSLTDKGEEMYYLLIDIERDKEVDPFGMMTALIKLDGKQEFWFFTASIGMIVSIWTVMMGILAIIFSFEDPVINRIYVVIIGITLIVVGVLIGYRSFSYYLRTINDLLGHQPTKSKIPSTIFFLNIQWYMIRSKNRIAYLFTTFFALLGWFIFLLGLLLHITEGVADTGPILFWLEGFAILALFLGIIMSRRIFVQNT